MLLFFFSQVELSPCLLIRDDLPVLDQHLPDLLHEDMVVAEQDGERGVGVVEAVQQHLRHLPLLLPYQPVRQSVCHSVQIKYLQNMLKYFLPFPLLLSSLPRLPQDFKKLRFVAENIYTFMNY